MGDENYKLELEQLKSSISAHVEAYELQAEAYKEYSATLAKINELLRVIDDKIIDVKDMTKESLRDLIRNVVLIGQQLQELVSSTHLTDKHLIGRVDELLRFIFEMSRDADLKEDQVRGLIDRVAALEKEIQGRLSVFETLAREILAGQNEIKTMSLAAREKNMTKVVVKTWLGAILFLITLIGALMQLGIFKWVWGPK